MAVLPTPEQVADLLLDWPPIPLALSPSSAFCLIAQLQLALRHPANVGQSAEVSQEFIHKLRRHLPDELQPLIDAGFREES